MKILPFILLILTICLFSCNKDNETGKITKATLNGAVQKGPFLNGTAIDIYELDNSLTPTGKNYPSQIIDNSDTFELQNVSFLSPYVLLIANGYYFNEITNQNSTAQVTLNALSDITDKSTVNVNILSNLEKNRIEYLVSKGSSFSEAKIQAEGEVLAIFSVSKPDISDFEALDISKGGDNNAILLAISLIIQGFRTEAEMSDLMANISTDIRQDGKLDSETLGSMLVNDARLLDLAKIRTSLESRYANLGMQVTIPDFEKYVKQFLDNSSYTITNFIEYPEYSEYGENILYGDKTSFGSGYLSMAAKLPVGTSLKIVIKRGIWYYRALPEGPVNWTISGYDSMMEEQTFIVTESGKSCDLNIEISGEHTIEYYENNALLPTRVKVLE
jgi:hypothetical protein